MTAESLTVEEQVTNYDTMRHIRDVAVLLHRVVKDLLDRADAHDQSKLARPEVDQLAKARPLEGITYGSAEWKENMKSVEKMLAHHYANNRHHPQHFKGGVNDMTLVDLIEMFCDWKASSTRHADGNIRKSIEENGNRFGLSPQLIRILENTANELD